MKRVLEAVLLSVGVSAIVYLWVSLNAGGFREPTGSVSLPLGRTTAAGSPETPLRYRVVAERSEARYRVREQLAGISFPNDAVGTTRAIQGNLSLDPHGRILPGDSRMTVDLRMLQSDEARRDNYLRRNTLDTDRYPTVVFVPTEVRGLRSPLPQSGSASFELIGDLTLRGVSRRISWEATATFADPEISVQAKTAFRFADFALDIPRVSRVLSVEDNIRLEIDLLLRRSS